MNIIARVMIAGIGGASLGTEILKALRLAGRYEIFGADVSHTAYGLYAQGFARTWCISRANYVADVIDACAEARANFLIPGGEQPMLMLSAASERLAAQGIRLLANSAEVIERFSNKAETFERLCQSGFSTPKTVIIENEGDIERVGLPCIVKPATGSGGSYAVFYAVTTGEAKGYADFIRNTGCIPIAQEYIQEREGEFTIGVLSLPDGDLFGSIALRRVLDSKLSVAYRGRGGIISSGYSQGHIAEYQHVCQQAEAIARAVDSKGPINIQGRLRDGVLLPFEINPRFSASTYLRALAGFNEIDILIQYLNSGELPAGPTIRSGWYLRSLTEQFVAEGELK